MPLKPCRIFNKKGANKQKTLKLHRLLSNRNCASRGQPNDIIDLGAEIALLYEPLRWAICTTNSLFLGGKSLTV